jgi:hypothetical protein
MAESPFRTMQRAASATTTLASDRARAAILRLQNRDVSALPGMDGLGLG